MKKVSSFEFGGDAPGLDIANCASMVEGPNIRSQKVDVYVFYDVCLRRLGDLTKPHFRIGAGLGKFHFDVTRRKWLPHILTEIRSMEATNQQTDHAHLVPNQCQHPPHCEIGFWSWTRRSAAPFRPQCCLRWDSPSRVQ